MTRNLVWTYSANATLAEVVDCLNVINPHGYSVADIKNAVQREFDSGLSSYVGTAGWYATVYPAPGSDTDWHCLPTLMAFSVMMYLNRIKHDHPV